MTGRDNGAKTGRRPKVRRVYLARTEGSCDRCPRPILPGQRIMFLDTDEYIHAEHLATGGRS